MRPPEPLPNADYLVVESTYGDRLHGKDDVLDALARIAGERSRSGACSWCRRSRSAARSTCCI